MKTHLLIVDPQNSFCSPEGELCVPNADADMIRLADFISEFGKTIDRISVTLDSHNRIHIAHPVWWIDQDGNHPEPFTQITLKDMTTGRFKPANPAYAAWSESYLGQVTNHTIWPYHCITGTWGHAVFEPLLQALNDWGQTHADIDFYFKGGCRFTEHFSAITPSVEVPDDPTTRPNIRLVNSLSEAETILVAGEASSHCVAETVKDAIRLSPSLSGRITLLTDAMSAVPGFEVNASNFFNDALKHGIKTTTTTSTGLV